MKLLTPPLVFALAVATGQLGCSVASSNTSEVSTLVARNCASVTQLALAGPELVSRATGGGVAAEVWISGEFVPDIRITLWQSGASVTAEVVRSSSDRGSVCEQLRRIFESAPYATPAEAARRVSVTRRTYTSVTIPQLAELLEEAQELKIEAHLSDSIFMPNRRVSFHLVKDLEELEVSFNQAEPLAEGVAFSGKLETSQPAIRDWVDTLLQVLGLP